MRMIKKICSVICAAVIALGGVNIVVTAQDTESQIKYNYKLSMESDSDFRMVYSYNGGTISTKKSYVSGKYGNAMQITYPGHEISDPSKRYNGFVMQFKSEPIELANESISMLDLMRDTKIFPCGYIHLRQLTTGMVQQSIVFLKSPWSIQVQRGTRSIQKSSNFQTTANGNT